MAELRGGKPATPLYIVAQLVVTLALIGVSLLLPQYQGLILGAVVTNWLREGAYIAATSGQAASAVSKSANLRALAAAAADAVDVTPAAPPVATVPAQPAPPAVETGDART